jgi:BMFP domain-containing protein YqiC
MQIDNKLFDDLARMAAGAAGTAIGVRDEIEAQVRQQAERLLSRMDLVTRDEFEAVREMASQARAEQEAMAARLEALEQRLAEAGGPAGPAGAEGAPRNPSEGA